MVYVALNVALCFPEIYDPKAGRTDETDYRHTAFYQYMPRNATRPIYPSKAIPYPHQQFFGIPRDHFGENFESLRNISRKHWLHQTKNVHGAGHYGLLSFNEFLDLEGPLLEPYLPSKNDVESVKRLLFSNKLRVPFELVLMIMDFADYKAERILEVPHDPLHPTNRAALDEYLDQCWQIIVGCNIINDELGMDRTDWPGELRWVMNDLFRLVPGQYQRKTLTGMECTGL